MAASQCLDDLPDWRTPLGAQHLNVKELYNERHRLALEELIAGGLDSFKAFLNREKIPNFLSEDEIKRITRAAVVPRSVSLMGDETVLETSTGGTLDCSSVTYFPEVSDVEAPVLEIGWPAFTAGSYRGVTRAVAHFQPSYGECIYSCKEAVRRMIKGAKEVIAIVTDSLTDLDIFKDLQEACTRRRIPVYILLDQSNLPSFQQMCKNLDVQLDDLRLMRVRTIAGSTYYMRSGARITGKVHERFMLVDGNRVATGSYRFNWTDGKINSSNLIELSGQITENFDEEFRILYAQSLPLNARGPPSARNSGIYDHLLKPFATPPPQLPRAAVPEPLLQVCLTSTPTRAQGPDLTRRKRPEDGGGKCSAVSNSSTLGEDWIEQELRQEVLITDDPPCVQKLLSDHSTNTSAMDLVITPALPSCHISTQTSCLTHDSGVQTDMSTLPEQTKAPFCTSTSSTQTSRSISNSSGSHSSNQEHHAVLKDQRPPIRRGIPAPDSNLRECFRKLTKERQYHYSTIRSKLDHMVSMLSNRRELVDLTNLALAPSPHRVRKNQQDGRQAPAMIDNTFMGTWPRSRCLH